jgi:hypothetical protein
MKSYSHISGGKALSIPNTEGRIQVFSVEGKALAYINYSNTWYRNSVKDDGGWSLEKINLQNYCDDLSNFRASTSVYGGTPGSENSVKDENINGIPISLQSYEILNARQISLQWNKNVFTESINVQNQILLNEQSGLATLSITSPDAWTLTFPNAFTLGSNHISLQNIQDWCENRVDTSIAFVYESLRVISARLLNTYQAEIVFSESPADSSVKNPTNFVLNNGIDVLYVLSSEEQKNAYVLGFSQEIIPGTEYSLLLKGITDITGQTMTDTILKLYYHKADLYDLVLNELMINPEPSKGLPPFKYIEIYNRSDKTVDLQGYKFQYGSTLRNISTGSITPGGYAIICAKDNVQDFASYGNVAALDGTMSLSTVKQEIALFNQQNELIHSLFYSNDWYADEFKAAGGYSIEQIDAHRISSTAENWRATLAPEGGTPGKENSVMAKNYDVTQPEIITLEVLDAKRIQIHFSEEMAHESLSGLSNYTLNGELQTKEIQFPKLNFTELILIFDDAFDAAQIYNLSISENLTDIAGNKLSGKRNYAFSLPQQIEAGDLIINEILSSAKDNGSEYLELYNRTNKWLDASALYLVKASFEQTEIKDEPIRLSSYKQLIAPYSYQVLTISKEGVLPFYEVPENASFIVNGSIPALTSEMALYLIDTLANTIDMIRYSEEWHFSLLSNTKGISLERLDASQEATDASNWHSTASTAGYGTPGAPNSQQIADAKETDALITLSSATFSPDNDGYEDRLTISYKLDKAGYSANVYILNAQGQMMIHLLNNELLGSEGSFFWDGLQHDGSLAPMGIYVLLMEFYHTDGTLKSGKKPVVLARKIR